MNKVTLVGRLVADPEIKSTTNGTATCRVVIAVEQRFKSADGERKSDFIPITAWKQTAEFITRFFKKGEKIGICGSIRVNNYQNNEGKWINNWSVNADEVYFIESKGSKQEYREPQRQQEQQFESADPDGIGLPFDL